MTSIASMEPLLPAAGQAELEDLATDLVARSSALAGKLHPIMRRSIGTLVRSMNCYYSNLIEGHYTFPVDIDRAMQGEYDQDARKRNLQLEARAHIEVQQLIDAGEAPSPVVSKEMILWLHRQFCQRMPDELLWVENPKTGERLHVVPGELRQRHVQVGRHQAPEPEVLDALLARFVEAYGSLSRIRTVIATAASHHRLLWIHPFLDGNGRVTRLFSHALMREMGVGSELWSVSRGLARNVSDYKSLLMAADEPRRGDLDGRGSLTQSGLDDFCKFFLVTCVDQVKFMDELFEPSELMQRIEIWTEEEVRAKRLLKGSWPLLREAILAGEFARSRAADVTGWEDRQARKVLSALVDGGYLVSDTPKGSVRLGLPQAVVDRWFPRLFVAPAGA